MRSGSSDDTEPADAGLLDEILAEMRRGRAPDADVLAARFAETPDDVRQLIRVAQFVHGAAEQADPTEQLDARVVVDRTRPTLGDFRIEREIARGGMGIVYAATQLSLNRPVALKVLLRGVAVSKDTLVRFQREAATAGGLQHRHIVPVFAVGEEDGVPFYAMQLIEGRSLSEHVKELRAQRYKPDTDYFRRVAKWGQQIADALTCAHDRGVIHRDIKPSNVLLDPDDNVWVTDFGLARRDAHVTLTMTGDVLGTVRYMSPEQARGVGAVDARTDVYSLGATLYELAALRPPFEGLDRESTLKQVLLDDPMPLREAECRVPAGLQAIILRAMEKRVHRRYPGARQLGEDLRRFLAREPLMAKPPGALARLRRTIERNRAASAFVGALLLASVGFGAWMSVLYADAQALRREAERRGAQAEREKEKALESQRFLAEMLTSTSPEQAQGKDTTLLRELLESAAERVDTEIQNAEVAATIRGAIGRTYAALGLFDDAERHLRAALDATAALDAHSDEYRRARLDWSRLTHDRGGFREAEGQYTELEQDFARAIGPDHEDTLRALHGRAQTILDDDRLADALPLLLDAEARARAALGDAHEVTVALSGGLAEIYFQVHDLPEAEARQARVYETLRQTLGESHPDTLDAAGGLAVIYRGMGRLENAERLSSRTLAARRAVQGHEHPDTLIATQNHARLLLEQGRLEEAERLLADALAIERRVLGVRHQITIYTMYTLAGVLKDRGKYAEAEPLMAEQLEVTRDFYGAEHPETIDATNHAGALFLALGDLKRAEPLFREAQALAAKALSENDYRRVRIGRDLGECLLRRGDYASAEPLLLDALEKTAAIFGPAHAETAVPRRLLFELYTQTGRAGQADAYRQPDGD